MLFSYSSFNFSVSSCFIMISARSSFFTRFLKSILVSRREDGCGTLVSFAFFIMEVLVSSLKLLSFLRSYNHAS